MKKESDKIKQLRKIRRIKLLEGFNSKCGICGYDKKEILEFIFRFGSIRQDRKSVV